MAARFPEVSKGIVSPMIGLKINRQFILILIATELAVVSHSLPITEPCLNSSDLRVVFKELFQVRAKWRRLGLELDLTPGTLDSIELRHSDPADQLERVLLEWFKKGSATWRQLVEALWSTPVGEVKLARDLEEKYCQKGWY